MVQATKFLLRWLYLNNLIRDRAEIQLLPHIQHPSTNQQPPLQQQHYHPQHQQQQQEQQQQQQTKQYQQNPQDPYQQQQQPYQQQTYNPPNTFHPQPPPQHTPPTNTISPRTPSMPSSQQQHSQYQHHPNHNNSPPPPFGTTTHQHPNFSSSSPPSSSLEAEEEWKRKALYAIALYPPGSARLRALDSLRLEIVHEFGRELRNADAIVQKYFVSGGDGVEGVGEGAAVAAAVRRGKETVYDDENVVLVGEDDGDGEVDIGGDGDDADGGVDNNDGEDILHDADLKILEAFQEATGCEVRGIGSGGDGSTSSIENGDDVDNDNHDDTQDSTIQGSSSFIKNEGDENENEGEGEEDSKAKPTSRLPQPPSYFTKQRSPVTPRVPIPQQKPTTKNPDTATSTKPTLGQYQAAISLLQETREYLPQLVSAILHSPPSLTYDNTSSLNPLLKIRQLLLTRCLIDANLGIELCWLLEAEVGRAWKTLFEHRQRTGRRLIVVLPAEKARVIAKIGVERRSAFEMLQDVEGTTAYGVYDDTISGGVGGVEGVEQHRLPSSLSLRRCRHFGDTMHFIDRLTEISLHLRSVPTLKRRMHLMENLAELNRRVRRRMVTGGDVSLDVEDGRGSRGWPSVEDVTDEMLCCSVHLPLEPRSCAWPSGEYNPPNPTPSSQHQYTTSTSPTSPHSNPLSSPTASAAAAAAATTIENELPSNNPQSRRKRGVMRVLNIVPEKCRLLASRERCPYLVCCEIAETGLDGSDARLYAATSPDEDAKVGATLQEVLGMVERKMKRGNRSSDGGGDDGGGFTSYRIPPELFVAGGGGGNDDTIGKRRENDFNNQQQQQQQPATTITQNDTFPRGGYQEGTEDNDGYYHPNHQPSHADDGSSSYLHYGGYEDDGTANQYQSPYDLVREEQLRQLMMQEQWQQQNQRRQLLQQEQQQLQQQYGHPSQMGQDMGMAGTGPNGKPMLTTYDTLLDRVFGPLWSTECTQIRQASPFGQVQGWALASFILKAGEDIRREALVMQVISKLKGWFETDIPEQNRPYLKPYSIMCVGGDAGLLECVRDSKSIDEVKKETDGFVSLRAYFERAYGPPSSSSSISTDSGNDDGSGSITFETAQENFLRSLVGYSLVCYILQIKDRHNANILLDRFGHLLHIDFGFVLGDTPKMGKVPLFSERAPFKLTSEFWEVVGGWNLQKGGLGVRFCRMFEEAFACASDHVDEIATLVEAGLTNLSRNPMGARLVANGVRARLRMRGERESAAQQSFVMDLVNAALTSWGTSTYDWLQKSMNGYI